MSARSRPPWPRPVNVAVLVDLFRDESAGGHVKVWERFAEAAVAFPDALDLTVYFLGHEEGETPLSGSVRYRTVPARFGTHRFRILQQDAGHTDLAGYNPRLARRLADHRVIHATSAFAFAKTGCRVARRDGRAFVVSLHTDVPKFTRHYSREILGKMFRGGPVARWLTDRARLPDLFAGVLARDRDRMVTAGRHVLVSSEDDRRYACALVGEERVSWLRRGVDTALFSPDRRDRDWLTAEFGVPGDATVALFAGRVDETKGAVTVAKAARILIDEGEPLVAVFAGTGSAEGEIRALLDGHVRLTGALPQGRLARVMASADLFAFPSETEIAANAVLEARASGLPVVLTAGAATTRHVNRPGEDGLIARERSAEAFADAMGVLVRDPQLRRRMGEDARRLVVESWPTWQDVVAEDLLPVWRSVAP